MDYQICSDQLHCNFTVENPGNKTVTTTNCTFTVLTCNNIELIKGRFVDYYSMECPHLHN